MLFGSQLLIYQPMKDFQEDVLGSGSLLKSIRIQKQHAERGVDKLLEQFSEENKFFDELRCLGSKYQSRLKEFEALKVQNADLRLQTRKIHQQLALLRSSLQDSGLREQDIMNRISVDRGKVDGSGNFNTNQTSARESMKSKLIQIQQMKQQATSQYQQLFKNEDDLLKSILRFLEMSYNTKQLIKQMNPSKGEQFGEEMVTVPRKRYEKLIEIYSTNMADLSAKQLERHLVAKKVEGSQVKLEEESQKHYKEKYSSIVSENDLDISSLSTFFRRLSQKFGFEKEWQRYHIGNSDEAVKLKAKIDAIFPPPSKMLDDNNKPVLKEGPKELENSQSTLEQLKSKVTHLVRQLSFTKKQKDCWSDLSNKIHDNQLINMPKIMQTIINLNKERDNTLIEESARFIHQILKECVRKFDKLLRSKYKKQILNLQPIQELIKEETLKESLQAKMGEERIPNLWKLSISQCHQKFEKIFSSFEEHLKFVAAGQIIRSLRPSLI